MRRVKRLWFSVFATVGFAALAPAWHVSGQTPATAVTVFQGARLITGDGTPPIEDSAFIVQNDQFTRVGRRSDVQVRRGRGAST